jgi:hypothetical protein
MITFFTVGAGVVIVTALTNFLKKTILDGFWLHVGAFVVSFGLCAGYEIFTYTGGAMDGLAWLREAGMVYTGAVTLYEAVLKRL